jgi:hypothetical protein
VKSFHRGLPETNQAPDNNVYYMLTLDPTEKNHRVIALLIDYTSRIRECTFYRPDEANHCSIAPDFTVMWNDCSGRCFVSGLTCPVILYHIKEPEESSDKSNIAK